MITVYLYGKCSTCRAAVAWLEKNNIPYRAKAIRETPPAIEELRAALKIHGGEIRRLFNTSGMDYRALGMKDKLPAMSAADALALLAANGNLVKRPFVSADGIALNGFNPESWARTLLT
ncbi:MAG: Spx/MgsR family RNA polymerase-binding regulatory protein [Verrucomicrobiota bacterium]